jgi:hypothetical protein
MNAADISPVCSGAMESRMIQMDFRYKLLSIIVGTTHTN